MNKQKLEHARWKLSKLLEQCSKAENNLFNTMYGSVNTIKSKDIVWATKQTEHSIKAREDRLDDLLLNPTKQSVPRTSPWGRI